MSKLVLHIHGFLFMLHQLGIPFLPNLLNKILIRVPFSCQLGVGTKIGKGVNLSYGGLGIVIHDRAVIGDNVSIGTGVTIGGTSKKHAVPVIGANTIIATGAKILGPIEVGNNCVIGANAVVLHSIADNCVAVGIPARVIKRDISIADYRNMN